MAFVADTLTLTAISPSAVEDDGGARVVLTGQWADAEMTITVVDVDGTEHPCYSGVAGQGYTPRPSSGTSVAFVTPPLSVGGSYAIRVRQGDLTTTLEGVLDVENRSFKSRTYALRQAMQPRLQVGARVVIDEPPLATDAPVRLVTLGGSIVLTPGSDELQALPAVFTPEPNHFWAMAAIVAMPTPHVEDEGSTGGIDLGVGASQRHVGSNLYVEWDADVDLTADVGYSLNDSDIPFVRTEPFSLAVWLSYTNKTPVGTITFITSGNAALEVRDDPRRLFAFYDEEEEFVASVNQDVGAGPSAGTFHLFTLTSSGSQLKWYVDGTLVKTQAGEIWALSTLAFMMSLTGSGLQSGKWGQGGLWRNTVLSAGQVADLFDRGPNLRIRF